jgi:RNA polymerase sigma-70 factor, ECF subfamily
MALTSMREDGSGRLGGRVDARKEYTPIDASSDASPVFGVLYERHAATVFRYLYGQTGSRETAEDLTSTTFLRALAAFPRFQSAQPFTPWLLRIAHNTLIDHRRATTRVTRLLARIAGMRVEYAYSHPVDDDAAHFLALTAGLPSTQRAALALRFLAGLELEETAAVLGRSRAATRMLLVRALRTLRARAEQEGSR